MKACRSLGIILLMLIISLFTACDQASAPMAPTIQDDEITSPALASWHNKTQTQRNQAIRTRAFQNNNQLVGLSCKNWVKAVVLAASTDITLPPTCPVPNDYYWQPHQYVVGRSGLIEYAQPGEIVQMRLSNGGPHTAIVYARSASAVTFIESNWDLTPEIDSDARVAVRTVPFTTFYNQVSQYTIMYIL